MAERVSRKERADQALRRLDGIPLMLPDPELFLCQYVRKEALLSPQIEDRQSSLSDLLLFELDAAPGVPIDAMEAVSKTLLRSTTAYASSKPIPVEWCAADRNEAVFGHVMDWSDLYSDDGARFD